MSVLRRVKVLTRKSVLREGANNALHDIDTSSALRTVLVLLRDSAVDLRCSFMETLGEPSGSEAGGDLVHLACPPPPLGTRGQSRLTHQLGQLCARYGPFSEKLFFHVFHARKGPHSQQQSAGSLGPRCIAHLQSGRCRWPLRDDLGPHVGEIEQSGDVGCAMTREVEPRGLAATWGCPDDPPVYVAASRTFDQRPHLHRPAGRDGVGVDVTPLVP